MCQNGAFAETLTIVSLPAVLQKNVRPRHAQIQFLKRV